VIIRTPGRFLSLEDNPDVLMITEGRRPRARWAAGGGIAVSHGVENVCRESASEVRLN
jgi:hypothetical protein